MLIRVGGGCPEMSIWFFCCFIFKAFFRSVLAFFDTYLVVFVLLLPKTLQESQKAAQRTSNWLSRLPTDQQNQAINRPTTRRLELLWAAKNRNENMYSEVNNVSFKVMFRMKTYTVKCRM